MNALLVGDTDGVSVSAAEAFRRSGTYHMFSVSGSHVAVIMFLIGAVLSSIPFAWRMPIIITATGLYVWLSGSDPPAIRAAIMGTVFLVGRSIERRTLPVNTLCAATFAMVTIDPFLVRDTGMILSVMAVGAIVGLGPWWTRRMARHTSARWVRSILPALGVSMAASLGTMPLTAIEFGVIACAAPLANLVVVPLLSAALVCGALLVVADPIGCGQPVAWFATACIHLATGVAEVAARWAVIDAEQGAMASIAVALGAAWLWPLIAPTMFGVVARWSAAHMVAAGLVLVAPRSTFETVHAPRRHGTVVACVRKDTLLLLTIGGPNAPVDTRLLAWVRHWPGHVRSAGIGVWGRRMSGRITRIMVPTQHEHHTRIR
jgi:ComEC/Rec2-related protein